MIIDDFFCENDATLEAMPEHLGGWLASFPNSKAAVFVLVKGSEVQQFRVRCAATDTERQYVSLGVRGNLRGAFARHFLLCPRHVLTVKIFSICRSFSADGGRFEISMPRGGSVRIFEATVAPIVDYEGGWTFRRGPKAA